MDGYKEVFGYSDEEPEQQFAYDDKYIATNYGNDTDDDSGDDYEYDLPTIQTPSRKPTENVKGYQIPKKTMSYKDTMKLIDYIFISNYWDKKIGNAKLVDSPQILNWMEHFKNVNFDILNSKSDYYRDSNDQNSNMMSIPNLIKSSYHIIHELLLLGKGKISLCGGSLTQLINYKLNNGDWDLFFHCETVQEADNLLSGCFQLIENNRVHGLIDDVIHSKTQRVHTVEYGDIKIQFIKRIYKSKDQVLLGFDLAPSRIGYNVIDGLYATICGGLSIAMKCYPLDTTQRSMSFGYRLWKYMNKGFKILYPGLPVTFNSDIVTPDGSLKYYKNNYSFSPKKLVESDYEDNDGDHMNWFYILSEKYHLINFEGDLNEVTELSQEFVKNSIENHVLFDINKNNHVNRINIKSYKSFLGDKYKEFINTLVIDEDEKKASQIWKERCDWYVQKGLEIAETLKQNNWKTENPGSQSFGKFNPILEHPKMWYGDNYQSLEVGIKTPQFKALVSCLINIIPEEIINTICNFWLKAEVDIARDYLFSLKNVTSSQSHVLYKETKQILQTIPTIHTHYNLG